MGWFGWPSSTKARILSVKAAGTHACQELCPLSHTTQGRQPLVAGYVIGFVSQPTLEFTQEYTHKKGTVLESTLKAFILQFLRKSMYTCVCACLRACLLVHLEITIPVGWASNTNN